MRAPPTPLGVLEESVMEHVWTEGEADVKSTWAVVGKRRKVTPNTIQSTMDRLFKKGLLTRRKVSHAFVYQASMSQAAYRADVVRSVALAVGGGEADAMLAAFVDAAADVGDDTLARLEALISERRRREDER